MLNAQEEYCTGVVSSVLNTMCPGCWCNPGSQILADLMMFISWNRIFVITLILFKKQEQFQLFHGHVSRTRSDAGMIIFSVSQLCVTETQYH